jgi:hypothetical protein
MKEILLKVALNTIKQTIKLMMTVFVENGEIGQFYSD